MNKSSPDRLRIIVLGYVVRGPLGGLAWHHLQYLVGLAHLGHDVYFVEDSDDYASCYNPVTNVTSTDPTYGLRFAAQTFDDVGLGDLWCYYDKHREQWHGPVSTRVRSIVATADMLFNLSGVNPLRSWLLDVPIRVLVDTDPVFTQIRHLTDPESHSRASLHNRFFSFGENFGLPGCSIPDDGFPWQRTRQPICLGAWPVTPGVPLGKLTAVMQWRSYDEAEFRGAKYGMKSASFPPYMDLPKRIGPILELAIGARESHRAELTRRGWSVVDPRVPTSDIWKYQHYIRQSRAEFGIAKHGYVISHSGWFSERSACYLASGRPVVVQDTGFSDWLPTGSGVLAFTNPDDVVRSVEELAFRYEYHCRTAREIVEAYFSAADVLASLVQRAMADPSGVASRPPSAHRADDEVVE